MAVIVIHLLKVVDVAHHDGKWRLFLQRGLHHLGEKAFGVDLVEKTSEPVQYGLFLSLIVFLLEFALRRDVSDRNQRTEDFARVRKDGYPAQNQLKVGLGFGGACQFIQPE